MNELDSLSGSALRGLKAKILRDTSGHGLPVGTTVKILNVTTMSGDTVVSVRGATGEKTYTELKELSVSDAPAPKRRKPATRRKAAPKRRKPATRRKAAPKRRKPATRRKAAPKRRKPATRRKAAPKRRKPATRRKAAPKRRAMYPKTPWSPMKRKPKKKVSKQEFLARMAAGRRKAAKRRKAAPSRFGAREAKHMARELVERAARIRGGG